MYTPINGFTKKSIIEAIRQGNNGKRSTMENSDIDCAYRSADGNACAVGCFIPAEHYTRAMETKTVSVVLEEYPYLKELMPLDVTALVRLQHVHDNSGIVQNMREHLITWVEENVTD